MAFEIPKLQYNITETTGDTTNGSASITNIPNTTDIEVGMVVVGTGIPAGSTVASKDASGVVLNSPNVASITNTTVALTFGKEISFDYPPKEERGERLSPSENESTSLSGVRQVSTNYIEATRSMQLSFLSHTLYLAVKTFFETSAIYGESFRWFDDKTSTSYVEYELDSRDFDPKKITGKGANQYIWEIPLKLRRVL